RDYAKWALIRSDGTSPNVSTSTGGAPAMICGRPRSSAVASGLVEVPPGTRPSDSWCPPPAPPHVAAAQADRGQTAQDEAWGLRDGGDDEDPAVRTLGHGHPVEQHIQRVGTGIHQDRAGRRRQPIEGRREREWDGRVREQRDPRERAGEEL